VIWHLLFAKGSPIEKRQARLVVVQGQLMFNMHLVKKIEGQEQAVAA